MSQSGYPTITAEDAKARIEELGCTDVADLRDDGGTWRATAKRDGRTVRVTVDAMGNIFVESV